MTKWTAKVTRAALLILAASATVAGVGCGARGRSDQVPAGMKSAPLSAAQAGAIQQKYQARVHSQP